MNTDSKAKQKSTPGVGSSALLDGQIVVPITQLPRYKRFWRLRLLEFRMGLLKLRAFRSNLRMLLLLRRVMLMAGSNQCSDPVTGITIHRGAFFNDVVNLLKRFKNVQKWYLLPSNDPSSATRPPRPVDCNRNAMAGFAAAHG